MSAFDPFETFAYLGDDRGVALLDVTADFWERLASRTDLGGGRLVSAYRFAKDWSNWERHPAGDEYVVQFAGAMDFVLDVDGGERIVELRGRAAVVVPRNVWHTARVLEPSDAMFITRGDGTEHRPIYVFLVALCSGALRAIPTTALATAWCTAFRIEVDPARATRADRRASLRPRPPNERARPRERDRASGVPTRSRPSPVRTPPR